MATLNISDLVNDAANWEDHRPDYAVAVQLAGYGVATAGNTIAQNLCNMAQRTPIVLACMFDNDTDNISILHSPHYFNPDPTRAASPYDSNMFCLMGNDLATSHCVVIPTNQMGRTNQLIVPTVATIDAGLPVPTYRFGPYAALGGDSENQYGRRIHLLPFSAQQDILRTNPEGSYPIQEFYTRFIQPGMAGDPASQALWEPTLNWYKCAVTNTNASGAVCTPTLTSPLPRNQAKLRAMHDRQKTNLLARAGVAPHPVTTLDAATFNTGILDLRQSMTAASDAQLAYQRASKIKSFSSHHGEPLAVLLRRLTGAADDDGLPQIHKDLVNASKPQAYSLLTSAFQTRALASDLDIDSSAAPIATTTIVNEVFRVAKCYATGSILGQGLTPFAMICEHHQEAQAFASKSRRAAMAEEGGNLSLQDADTLLAGDIKLPANGNQAADKLMAFSVAVDIFHGHNHPMSVAIRNVARLVSPALRRLTTQYEDPTLQQDLCCRVLFEIQQDYFFWCSSVATSPPGARLPDVPTFSQVSKAVQSMRISSLAQVPPLWGRFMLQRIPEKGPSKTNKPGESSSGTKVYAEADTSLIERFKNSRFDKVSSMAQGHESSIPKHNGKEVCLTWALKGRCSNKCQRKDSHVNYPTSVKQSLHQFLSDCGVDRP